MSICTSTFVISAHIKPPRCGFWAEHYHLGHHILLVSHFPLAWQNCPPTKSLLLVMWHVSSHYCTWLLFEQWHEALKALEFPSIRRGELVLQGSRTGVFWFILVVAVSFVAEVHVSNICTCRWRFNSWTALFTAMHEVEISGGVPTLLRSSKLLFVDASLA